MARLNFAKGLAGEVKLAAGPVGSLLRIVIFEILRSYTHNGLIQGVSA